MRESNFAFPAQNKACVCITSQLYDRRALDTTAALPLFNSLTHLTYLTSTSPRIREIMTMDGGLERLVRILHEFCLCPPPPENPALLYGLTPPSARPPKLVPALNPGSFDKHAAYRFSLAFQCIVNIGVRGSEPIRSRVVQAGTLDVVGCILEAWLANKGFAVGPSAGASGGSGSTQRETREQRHQRKLEQRQREDAAHLQRALQRQLQVEQQRPVRRTEEQDESMEYSPAGASSSSSSHILLLSDSVSQLSNPASASNSDTDVSTDNSIAATPQETGTPTGTVVISSRDRSGTIIARPVWDQPQQPAHHIHHNLHHHHAVAQNGNAVAGPATFPIPPRGRRIRHRELPPDSPATSTDASRAETENEEDYDDASGDGDGDVDMDQTEDSISSGNLSLQIDSDVASASASPSPERRPRNPRHGLARRAVGIVSDEPPTVPQTLQVAGLGMGVDEGHIFITEAGAVGVGVGVGDGGVEVGVEDGIVSLEQNDDFAMGAPPGAPGAIGETPTPRGLNLNGIDAAVTMTADRRRRNTVTVDAPDVTPRAAVISLPTMAGGTVRGQPSQERGHRRDATIRARPAVPFDTAVAAGPAPAISPTTTNTPGVMPTTAAPTTTRAPSSAHASSSHHHRDADAGPYRDEDVLLSLQLLAYLSKYPHVRQAFYKPRVTFHPASVGLGGARFGVGAQGKMKEKEKAVDKDGKDKVGEKDKDGKDKEWTSSTAPATSGKDGFFRAFTNGATAGVGSSGNNASSSRGKERQTTLNAPSTSSLTTSGAPSSARQTNVFSLVERFTYKPSSSESGNAAGADGSNIPPRLPPEIQYWAGVIMRNACRKDDSRGGIRQCANMMCGKWETYPREFAKCRRCRKAKYCGKDCQSTAWSEGHRFWCSAKDVDDDAATATGSHHRERGERGDRERRTAAATTAGAGTGGGTVPVSDDGAGRIEVPISSAARTERRHRERHQGNTYVNASTTTSSITTTTTISANAASSMSRDRTLQPTPPFYPPSASLTASPAPHVRSRLMATIRPPPPPTSSAGHEPTRADSLSFHIQSASTAGSASGSGSDRERGEAGRKRAETISGSGGGSGSGLGSSSIASLTNVGHTRRSMATKVEVPPEVVLPGSTSGGSTTSSSSSAATRVMPNSPMQLQMSYTQTVTQGSIGSQGQVHTHLQLPSPVRAHGGARERDREAGLDDWPMASPTPSSRRLRRERGAGGEVHGEDDMVLG